MSIQINVTDKHATVVGAPVIVCGNSTYSVQFTFDDEWAAETKKVARFVWVQDGEVTHHDVELVDNACQVPALSNVVEVRVGAYAVNLCTSTPAVIPCERSILCGSGEAATAPTPSQYEEIMSLYAETESEIKILAEDLATTMAQDVTPFFNRLNGTQNGLTVNTGESGHFHIKGTASQYTFFNLYYTANGLPAWLKENAAYRVNYVAPESVALGFYFYNAAGATLLTEWLPGTMVRMVTVPRGTTQVTIRLFPTTGAAIDNDVRVRMSEVPEKKLAEYDGIPRYLITVIDDDASNDDFVTKFHDACLHNGIKGDYAVQTLPMDNGLTSVEKLLTYEAEGFGMLAHCHTQQEYFYNDNRRDLAACRENIVTMLRKMRQHGFVNYDYWITPYGSYDRGMQEIARYTGMKCLASIGQSLHNSYTNTDRYFIRRMGFSPADPSANGYGSLAGTKATIDTFVQGGGMGWLILVTHFNEWGDITWDSTLDANGHPVGYARFNELIQYAKGRGCKFVSFSEGYSYMKDAMLN